MKTLAFFSVDESVNVLEANIVCYVSGYLVHTFLKKKACEKCTVLLKDSSQELSSNSQVYMMFRAVEIEGKPLGHLTVPTQAALSFVHKLEALFNAQIGAVAHLVGVSRTLLDLALEIAKGPFCSGDCHNLFLQTYVRIRILWFLKFKNIELSKAKTLKSAAKIKLQKLV